MGRCSIWDAWEMCCGSCLAAQLGGGAGSFLLNIIWLIVSGLPLALEHLALGTALCVTIIGIPFGLQQFKLAKLALMPFGAEVY